MGLLDRFKMQEKVFKQDTTQIAEHPGIVFMVHLLMEEMSEMPEKEHVYENSLIQPIREVIDINMSEYAAGSR